MNETKETIDERAARLAKGWPEDHPYWHAYHNVIAAVIVSPRFRVYTILTAKPRRERETRLKLLKPIEDEDVIKWVREQHDMWNALSKPPHIVLDAHEKECCDDCPWDGTTIFPESED